MIIMQVSVQIGLSLTGLELSLAIFVKKRTKVHNIDIWPNEGQFCDDKGFYRFLILALRFDFIWFGKALKVLKLLEVFKVLEFLKEYRVQPRYRHFFSQRLLDFQEILRRLPGCVKNPRLYKNMTVAKNTIVKFMY